MITSTTLSVTKDFSVIMAEREEFVTPPKPVCPLTYVRVLEGYVVEAFFSINTKRFHVTVTKRFHGADIKIKRKSNSLFPKDAVDFDDAKVLHDYVINGIKENVKILRPRRVRKDYRPKIEKSKVRKILAKFKRRGKKR